MTKSQSLEAVSAAELKQVMACFAAGVTVVTTVDEGGKPQALTATAFTSVSAEPPLCLVCVHRDARARESIQASRRFVVNMLRHDQTDLSNHFASKVADKFEGKDFEQSPTGCPVLPGVLAWLDCELEAVHPGGDHEIFVGRLVAVRVFDGEPLAYFRGAYADVQRRG